MKHRGIAAFIGLLLVALVLGALFFASAVFIGSPQAGDTVSIVVPAGADASVVADALTAQHVITSVFLYRLYARFDALAQKPKAGTYDIRPGTSYRAIARLLALGQPRTESTLRIIEGWTVDDEIRYLQEEKRVDPVVSAKLVGRSADAGKFDAPLRDEYGFLKDLPSSRSLEGYLFPDTYRVWDDELPEGLVQKQLEAFKSRFGGVSVTAASAPLTSMDQVVILASIIEKEVRLPDDRRIVAGIFLRRLKEGMGLQSDATLTYVTGSSRSRSTAADLNLDSPYNTYRYRGLPPGPICNPGEDAIQAVLDPKLTSYRYFLTDKDGKVVYATTFEEHVRNKQMAGY